MLRAGGHVPTETEAPASARALAMAKPNPPSSATPATSALFPVRSILSMIWICRRRQGEGKGNRRTSVKPFELLLAALLAFGTSSGVLRAQTQDTLYSERALFGSTEGLLFAAFTVATIGAASADRRLTSELQDPARQAHRTLQRTATGARVWGNPGAIIASIALYGSGTAGSNRRVQDLGLHAIESVVISNVITLGIKVIAGRARPYLDRDDPADFKFMRGLRGSDYQAFPSGHTSAAFAFAAITTSETSRWSNNARWPVAAITYGAAVLTGASRIYNYRHWASDVVAGAAIGTITGLTVYRYQHAHPGNRIDNALLKAGLQSSGGKWTIIIAAVQR